jgi:hypothetical protein
MKLLSTSFAEGVPAIDVLKPLKSEHKKSFRIPASAKMAQYSPLARSFSGIFVSHKPDF